MPGGRPSKFQSIDLDQVKSVATRGWTDQEMADHFKVDVRTWYRWKLEHEEFCQALKDWKSQADLRVERSLFERAIGYCHPDEKIFNDSGKPLVVPTTKHYPPDTTAAIFWLKNRNPEAWRDKQELQVLGVDIAERLERGRKRVRDMG